MSDTNDIWPCVGICMPDEEEAYCLGCGRPWGEPRPVAPLEPAPESSTLEPATDDSTPAA